MKTHLIAICLYLSPLLLNAQQLITDRSDQTESAYTVPYKSLQIESGLQLRYSVLSGHATQEALLPTTLFRYGILPNVELRLVNQVQTNAYLEEKVSGIGDTEIGTKIKLFNSPNEKTSVAILSHVILPIGSLEASGDSWALINKLSVAHAFSDHYSLGYNLGLDINDQKDISFTYSVAFGISINEKCALYVEPYGGYENFQQFTLNSDAGLTYLLNRNFQLDFSFGAGISHRMNYVATGFSWLIHP